MLAHLDLMNQSLLHLSILTGVQRNQDAVSMLLVLVAHERSNLFYSESVRSNRFVARRCTGYAQITARNCPGSGTGIMGGDASKSINGVFFLETNAASPFARG
ncbi:hypothetical protein PVAND_016723 [Polypedilum vanderplanki]|uniref:Uncharacterized protein n=1 Tax=Polypedilum vanderplanki TaxID=319348 RepID=A0A9J6BG94_POLVA|nr:hypothetical protein PVAND_016723 [Polypedilum vanderplanki]